jgi:hypothetical protein
MDTRDIYRQKYEAQIRAWSAELDELGARAQMLTAGARLELKPRVDGAHAKLEAARTRLRHLAAASEEGWEDVMRDADEAWEDVKAAIEGALDAVARLAKR